MTQSIQGEQTPCPRCKHTAEMHGGPTGCAVILDGNKFCNCPVYKWDIIDGQTSSPMPVLDEAYNSDLNTAFKQHTTGRIYGEEELADAFEHFKSGFDTGLALSQLAGRKMREWPVDEVVAEIDHKYPLQMGGWGRESLFVYFKDLLPEIQILFRGTDQNYVTELEDALCDLAMLCYAPPEHFEINGGPGKGVCGTCDLGQDGSRVHGKGCGLQLGWDILRRRGALNG